MTASVPWTSKPQEHRGPLSTEIGKKWAPRIRRSDRAYERAKSRFCWNELRRLYLAEMRRATEWGSNVSMAWSVLQNLVADSFFKNPEPVIIPLNAAREEEARELTDVGRTWHETTNTEDNVMRARVLCGTTGGAVIWVEEDAEYQDARAYDDETGEPMSDPVTGEEWFELDPESGEVMKEAVRQEINQILGDLHNYRFDPDGMQWGWQDMKWVERRYERSLKDFLEDPKFSDSAKAMLRAWSKSRRFKKQSYEHDRDGEEKDPGFMPIACGAVWSMVDGKILHIPVGAEFHLEGADEETKNGFPMPSFWRNRRMYPGQMFAYNWAPPDEDGNDGFYPVPDLFLVKDQLKNLNRLEGLILNLCTQQTTKYITQDGLIDGKVQRRIASDVPREIIPVDFVGVWKRLINMGLQVPFDPEKLIVNLKTEQREQLIKHFEAFEHEVNLIRETLSQGPSQRGGVADSETATGQLQVGQAMQRRLDIEAERTSFYIDGLTERYFLLLQHRQTLPIYYRATGADGEAFRPFLVTQEFRDLKLAFRHRTGSARGIDRELQRVQLRETITNALPVVQDPTVIHKLLAKLFATFDDPTLQDIFKSDLSALAEEAAALQMKLEAGALSIEDAGPALLEILNAFVNAHLTQDGIDRAVQKSAGQPGPPAGGEKQGSAAKPRSGGQNAFHTAAGLASAGRVGGVN